MRDASDVMLAHLLAKVFATDTANHWVAGLAEAGIAAVEVCEDTFEEWLIKAGWVLPATDPNAGGYWRLPPMVEISGYESKLAAAPSIGENSVDVLKWAGFSDDQVQSLVSDGIVFSGQCAPVAPAPAQ
jgi:crotonobetainyl-CoA:carnitine CoA-transferase CaiB-like acyl-CoA transferase